MYTCLVVTLTNGSCWISKTLQRARPPLPHQPHARFLTHLIPRAPTPHGTAAGPGTRWNSKSLEASVSAQNRTMTQRCTYERSDAYRRLSAPYRHLSRRFVTTHRTRTLHTLHKFLRDPLSSHSRLHPTTIPTPSAEPPAVLHEALTTRAPCDRAFLTL